MTPVPNTHGNVLSTLYKQIGNDLSFAGNCKTWLIVSRTAYYCLDVLNLALCAVCPEQSFGSAGRSDGALPSWLLPLPRHPMRSIMAAQARYSEICPKV